MVKRTLCAAVMALLPVFLFAAADELDIILDSAFHLNPITGIKGDSLEESSKFVQRMVFSPLVFPLEDPYLQDAYKIALDLSLIEEKIQYEDDSGVMRDYDLKNPSRRNIPSSQVFRVKLRNNLEFSRSDKSGKIKAYSKLTAEDVVYSYRISRITIDRVYNVYYSGYSKKKTGSLGINTLMYSRIRGIEDVYCDGTSGEIRFKIQRTINCDDFVKLLVYVPILSMQQLTKSKGSNDTALMQRMHQPLNLSALRVNNAISGAEYNLLDFNYLLEHGGDLSRDFYDTPVGYGQFLVKETVSSSGNRTRDEFRDIYLVRNPNWCKFGSAPKDLADIKITNHNEYANSNLHLNIRKTSRNKKASDLIRDLKDTEVLYNVPLSANQFSTGDDLINNSTGKSKREMQISHNLYGIYFGPSIRNSPSPMLPSVRKFFAGFADRIRIENTVKFITGEAAINIFDNMARQKDPLLTSDIGIQKLYYPFYTGSTEDNETNKGALGQLYLKKEKEDFMFQDYKRTTRNREAIGHYKTLAPDQRTPEGEDFYFDYIGGDNFPDSFNISFLEEQFRDTAVRNAVLTGNKVNRICIFYVKDDDIGKTIGLHYRDVLSRFFKQKVGDFDTNTITIKEISDYQRWNVEALANAKNRTISFLVKGWSYKFDLLDEIKDEFIEDGTKLEIASNYIQLVESGAATLDSDRLCALIAEEFEKSTVMIPLVAVQNYAIYKTGKFEGFDKYSKGQILLLPYYWRKN